MSFSTEQKDEIVTQTIKNKCCKMAMLHGILATKGSLYQQSCNISCDSMSTAEFIRQLIFDLYSKESEISTSKQGGRRKIVKFENKSCVKYILGLNENSLYIEKCPNCFSSFLKGIFLACGRVSDPTKQYALEFSVGDRVEIFVKFFNEIGMLARVSRKPNETVIYFKNSTALEEFFTLAGMNNTVFSLMNAKIKGEFRNNANRVANCETNNIDKAVKASINQIGIIQKLIEKGLVSYLPEELEMTAKMRMEHRDLSLSQLANLFTPHITKSGLSHRLKKIVSIAQTLMDDKK